jgi:hypothetical protein
VPDEPPHDLLGVRVHSTLEQLQGVYPWGKPVVVDDQGKVRLLFFIQVFEPRRFRPSRRFRATFRAIPRR